MEHYIHMFQNFSSCWRKLQSYLEIALRHLKTTNKSKIQKEKTGRKRISSIPTLSSALLSSTIPYELTTFLTGRKDDDPVDKDVEKINRYWMNREFEDVIEEADKLFEQGQYLEVYELLNRMKYRNNPQVQWRISRCLFKLSHKKDVCPEVKNEMIREAFILITNALASGLDDFNIHKWMAILLDAKSGIEGTECRVRAAAKIKEHMLKAYELNPNDVVILYMLGKWCFEMSRLTFFQRCIARLLYATPPKASYEEAYFYFKKAYESESRLYYVPNIYLLGQTCLHLGQYFRAMFYLKLASELPPRTELERICVEKARCKVEKLQKYDLSTETVLFEFPFDEL